MARKRERRFWSEAEKRRIVAQTRVPGVSVSRVARRYDVNANLVFRWLRDPRFSGGDDDAARFLPVEVVPDAAAPATDRTRAFYGRNHCILGGYLTEAGSLLPVSVPVHLPPSVRLRTQMI